MKPIRRSDGKCYKSATEAAHEMVAETGAGNLQTALANITAVARGDSFRKSAYGYGWEYCEPLGDAYDEALRKITALEDLVRDMWRDYCLVTGYRIPFGSSGVSHTCVEYDERMKELGIEVSE